MRVLLSRSSQGSGWLWLALPKMVPQIETRVRDVYVTPASNNQGHKRLCPSNLARTGLDARDDKTKSWGKRNPYHELLAVPK